MCSIIYNILVPIIAGSGGGFISNLVIKEHERKQTISDTVKLLVIYHTDIVQNLTQQKKNISKWKTEDRLYEHMKYVKAEGKSNYLKYINELDNTGKITPESLLAWRKAAEKVDSYINSMIELESVVSLPRDSRKEIDRHIEVTEAAYAALREALEKTHGLEKINRKIRKCTTDLLKEMRCL